MTKSDRLVYWDACVFLSMIEAEPSRIDVIESILEDMEKGHFRICTSILSITEVSFAKAEKDGKTLDKAVEQKINWLWQPGSPFQLVDIYRSIATDARDLIRSSLVQGIRLKPPDAIHLATAKRIGAIEFQSYDVFSNKRNELSNLLGIKISEPSVNGKIVWKSDNSFEGEKREGTKRSKLPKKKKQ